MATEIHAGNFRPFKINPTLADGSPSVVDSDSVVVSSDDETMIQVRNVTKEPGDVPGSCKEIKGEVWGIAPPNDPTKVARITVTADPDPSAGAAPPITGASEDISVVASANPLAQTFTITLGNEAPGVPTAP